MSTMLRSIITLVVIAAVGLLISPAQGALFTFIPSGGNWSNSANWTVSGADTDGIPDADDDVTVPLDSGQSSVVDAAFKVQSLTHTGVSGFDPATISASGGGKITPGSFTKSGPGAPGAQTKVPIELDADTTFTASAGGGWQILGVVSETGGPQKIVKEGTDQIAFRTANSFSGGMDIFSGSVYFENGGLGFGAVTLGSGDGSGGTTLGPNNVGTSYTVTTNTVTVAAGSGARTFRGPTSNPSTAISIPLGFVLNKDLRMNMNNAAHDVTVTGSISGLSGLLVDGPGMLTLSGSLSYNGATTLTNGTLNVDGTMANSAVSVSNSGTLAGTGTINSGITVGSTGIMTGSLNVGGSITVNGGGVVDGTPLVTGPITVNTGGILQGTGTFNGGATISANATIAPGGSPGVTTFGGGLTLAADSIYTAEINGTTAGTDYDQIVVTGGAIDVSGAILDLTFGFSPAIGDSFLLLDNQTASSIIGNFELADGTVLTEGKKTIIGGTLFQSTYLLVGNGFGLIATVPEPSTILLLGVGAWIIHLVRKRRRHRGQLVSLIVAASILVAGVAQAANFTWDDGAGDDNWSSTDNWGPNGTPGSGDEVIFEGTAAGSSLVDGSFTVTTLTIQQSAATGTLTVGGSGTLTVEDGITFYSQRRPLAIANIEINDVIEFNAFGNHPRGEITSVIRGAGGINYTDSGGNTFKGNNTFTGGFTITKGTATEYAGGSGTAFGLGHISLGTAGGSDNTTINWVSNGSGKYGTAGASLTAQAGSGNRRMYLGAGSAYTFTMPMTFEKETEFDVWASSGLTLGSDISGGGGLLLRDSTVSTLTASRPATLTGSYTYSGTTTLRDLNVTLNGNIANSAVVVETTGGTSDGTTLQGTGTIGSGGVTVGNGTTLAGSLNIGGPITVNSGGVVSGTPLSTGPITVNTGGVLQGTGTFNGGATISANATIAPGGSPGVTTFGSGLTLAADSIYTAEINGTTAGTDYDQIVVTAGAIDVSGAILDLSLGFGPAVGDQFLLLDNQTGSSIIGNFELADSTVLTEGKKTIIGGTLFQATYLMVGNGFGLIATVPEPSSLLLLGLGGLIAYRVRRRGRQSKSLLPLIVAVALTLAGTAQAANYTWDDGAGDDNWSSTDNWNPNATPGSGDEVVYDSTAAGNSDVDGTFTVTTLTVNGSASTLDIVGSGTLTVEDAINFHNQRHGISVANLVVNDVIDWTNSGAHPRGTITSKISGNGGIKYGGADQMTFYNANTGVQSTFTGGFELETGIINAFANAGATVLGQGVINLGGQIDGSGNATINFTRTPGGNWNANGVTMNVESGAGSRNLNVGVGGNHTFSFPIGLEKDLNFLMPSSGTSQTITLNGAFSGAGGLILDGKDASPANVVLTATSTHAGQTTFTNLTTASVNGNFTQSPVLVTEATLQGTGTIGSGGVTVADNATLTGSLNIGGPITVNSGGVVSGTPLSTGPITVNTGGILQGTGTFNGGATISANATISPGGSPGVTTFGSGLTLAADSIYTAEINGTTAGTDYDQIVVTGGAIDVSGAILDLSMGFSPAVGDQFLLLDNQTGSSIIGNFELADSTVLTEGKKTIIGGTLFQATYLMVGNGFGLIATVPEPSTLLLLGVGGLIAYRVRQRRRG